MSIITGGTVIDLLGIITALIAIICVYSIWAHQYWKRRNIPCLPSKFFFVKALDILKKRKNFGEIFKSYYDELYKTNLRYGGAYLMLRPVLMITDLDLVKSVLIKDFDHFADRGLYTNDKGDPLNSHLFSIDGTRWHQLRTKLTPTFTSGKMKMMFETMAVCAPNMCDKIDENINQPIEIRDIVTRFTADVIGSCAFGLDCNSFKDPNSPFRIHGEKIFRRSVLTTLKQGLIMNFPNLSRALNARITPKDVEDFFMGILRDTINYREINQIRRNDFLQLMIDMKDQISFNEIAAQSFLFFLGGFETSATTISFALYNIASNQEIQEKLHLEINNVLKRHDDKLNYEAISEMKYLQQVIDETLRLYPPFPLLFRKCIKDYDLGDGNFIKRGEQIWISNYGIQMNENIYKDPKVFNPERFNEENKHDIHPAAFLSFGSGPRNCIGMRFGLLQTKVGLATLLKNYKFTVNSQTQDPLEMDPSSFVMSPKGGIWLNAVKN